MSVSAAAKDKAARLKTADRAVRRYMCITVYCLGRGAVSAAVMIPIAAPCFSFTVTTLCTGSLFVYRSAAVDKILEEGI